VEDSGPTKLWMGWTEKNRAELKKLWLEGVETKEIGRRLGTNKNVVIGKAHRLKLPGRPSPIRRGVEKKPRKSRATGRTFNVRPEPAPVTTLQPLTLPLVGVGEHVRALRLVAAINAAQPGSRCCWPMWNDRDRPNGLFCGDAAVPSRPYCDAHCAAAYMQVRAREFADAA
jgi:GcrA cell cycle regulator